MVKRVLLTGVAGFVGSHFLEHIMKATDWEVIGLARTSTVGDLNERIMGNKTLEQYKDRIRLVYADLKFGITPFVNDLIGPVDVVIHLAANSHVDRSILDPLVFMFDNVIGTTQLLEWVRKHNPKARVINFSTDEVFGPIVKPGKFTEEDRFRPSNPYAASKAAQTSIGYAYYATYGMDVINTFTMNIFGERQNKEKLIPKAMRKIIKGEPMPVFAELGPGGRLVGVGERHWLHARNAADATLFLIKHGKSGEFYNVVGNVERTNEEIVREVAKALGKEPIIEFVDFHKTRPGHDRRYSLDGSKLAKMGWTSPISFEEGIRKTVEWEMNVNGVVVK